MKGPVNFDVLEEDNCFNTLHIYILLLYVVICCYIFFAILKDVGSGWFWHLIHLMAGWH